MNAIYTMKSVRVGVTLLMVFIVGSAGAIDSSDANGYLPKDLPEDPLSSYGYQPSDPSHLLFAAPQAEKSTEVPSQQNQPSIVNPNDSRSGPISLHTESDRYTKAAWRTLSGTVWDSTHSQKLCALVLANGQHMFSCSPDGAYNLNVPEDSAGQITLFAFVDGQLPFKKTFTGGSFDGEIVMPPSSCNTGPKCGNGMCETGETPSSCPADCKQAPQCGNGMCETGETPSSCPADCKQAPQCGNGICETGETPSSCPADCGGAQTTIKLSITDACLDGKKMWWRFFDVDQNLVWPEPPKAYTGEENTRYTSSLLCNVGSKICYGATEDTSSNNPYWGVGINGDKSCSSCCYTCQSGLDTGWKLTCN